jgi:hypothetical protein
MMSRSRWSPVALGLTVSLFALVACSSSEEAPSPEASFCGALTSAYASCGGRAGACGDTMGAECTNLAALLNPSVLTAATACIEQASCGEDPLVCLGKAIGEVEPTEAQDRLAGSFCESCSPVSGAACKTAFFGNGSTPGLGIALLPFGEKPLSAVEESCTSNRLGKTACQAAFSTCLTATATKVLVESVSTDAVKCVFNGVKDGLSGSSGSSGSSGGSGGSGGSSGNGGDCTGCAGCCQDGECQSGTDAEACGSGGAACETCSGNATCTGGSCTSACGPDNCSGCCDDLGDCRTGATTDTCGAGGGRCAACSAGETCSGGACIARSCKASCASGCCDATGCRPGTSVNACGTGGNACVACGAGGSCSSGKCQIAASSKWDVVLVSAKIPPKSGGWDPFGGLPDPFARAKSGTTTGAAPTKNNTLNPVWNALVLKDVSTSSLKAQLEIEVWDDDTIFHDRVGTCQVAVTDASFDGNLKTATCPPLAKGDVTFSIDYRIKAH